MSARPVLLIDDDANSCDRVCRLLEGQGLTVETMHYATATLTHLNPDETPAALVLHDDCSTHESDGLLDRLHENSAWDGVPIVTVRSEAGLNYLGLLLGEETPHLHA